MYNGALVPIITLNSGITAMIGDQEYPRTGIPARGKEMQVVELEWRVGRPRSEISGWSELLT
jgi:hypothetical protein